MNNRARWASQLKQLAHRLLKSNDGSFIIRPVAAEIPPNPPPPDPTANLWVAPGGDDSRSKATVAGSGGALPWATLTRAVYGSSNRFTPNPSEAASAGDVVGVATGTYTTTGTNNRFIPAYSPVNNGTLGNPIIFQATETVYLPFSSGAGPILGSEGSYITWKGPFYCNGVTAPSTEDTGPVILVGDGVGNVLDGLIIQGVGYPWLDNYPGIRLEYTVGNTIKNCTISGFGSSTGGTNECGIQAYRSGTNIIENNLIQNCGTAIFLKGIAEEQWSGPWDIRKNKIKNCFRGVLVHRVGNTIAPAIKIYQNIISSIQFAVEFFNFGDATNVKNAHFINNTVYNLIIADAGFYCSGFALRFDFPPISNANCTIKNNIYQLLISYCNLHQGTGDTAFDDSQNILFDRNIYYLQDGAATFAVAGLEDVNLNMTFSQWQGSPHFQDVNGSYGANPNFVDVDSENFHLDPASFALTFGRATLGIGGSDGTVIPAGCYITGSETIGPA